MLLQVEMRMPLMALPLGAYPCMLKFFLGGLLTVAQQSCFVTTGNLVRLFANNTCDFACLIKYSVATNNIA